MEWTDEAEETKTRRRWHLSSKTDGDWDSRLLWDRDPQAQQDCPVGVEITNSIMARIPGRRTGGVECDGGGVCQAAQTTASLFLASRDNAGWQTRQEPLNRERWDRPVPRRGFFYGAMQRPPCREWFSEQLRWWERMDNTPYGRITSG